MMKDSREQLFGASIWPIGAPCPSRNSHLVVFLLLIITQTTAGANPASSASANHQDVLQHTWSIRRMAAAQEPIRTTPSMVQTSLNTSAIPASTTTPAPVPTMGFWLNQGMSYIKCPAAYEVDRCKDLPAAKKAPEKSPSSSSASPSSSSSVTKDAAEMWRPDYGELIERLSCTIKKINCPGNNRSFQLHDIPCQSACLTLVTICQRHLALSGPFSSDHIGCYLKQPLTPSDALWPIASGTYLNQVGASQPYLFPYRNNVFSQPAYSRFSRPLGSRRMGRELYDRYIYPRHNSYTNEPQFVSPHRPWSGPRARRGIPIARANFGLSSNAYATVARDILTEADCHLLPSGGCDRWTHELIDAEQYIDASIEQNVRINPGCPQNLPTMCDAMFPREYTRQQWVKGQYTVAAIIRIAQTLWWFGPNNQFQPFFRFHVTETLDSDIHPYDDKMILTYAWPSRCICPNEITADKTYLMLTHSIKSGQTLNITANTVFLSRVKRYTRRLACWKGSCVRKAERNRRRRYPSGRWHWNS